MAIYIALLIGLSKMNAAQLLSDMMQVPIEAGSVMHFMIVLIFSFANARQFSNFVQKVNSNIITGLLFGITLFIFAS